MFGGNNKKDNGKAKTAAKPVAAVSGLNSLVGGTVVEGDIRATSDMRVDGTIKGTLHCDAKVIIGPEGYIEGEIRCANAVIEGKFEGTLVVSELLQIKETASVNGKVHYGKLIVQSGATVTGTFSMGKPTNGSVNGQDHYEKTNASELAKKGKQKEAVN